MTSALISAALDRPLRADCAMTREVDLIGTVLPVGGIKEKTTAARRSGIRCLIFFQSERRKIGTCFRLIRQKESV